ncbi:hypothetical protein, partial [Luteolibacter marinus]|uniref:hypothetical protein n=1 Tax=Luteolibacter marinus TaxID=2776705 RepID=UPI0018676681
AVVGFFGGRWTGTAEAKKEAVVEAAATATKSPRFRPEPSTARASKPLPRRAVASAASGSPTVDLTREMIDRWNQQDIVLPDGEESELLLFDLTRFGKLVESLVRLNDDEIAGIRPALLPENNDSYEADNLKITAGLLVAGREIELHGIKALDDTVARALADPENAEIEDIMPVMLYTLAKQDPTAAEKWWAENSKRDDLDDFFDMDEMKAALEKSRTSP